MSSTPAAAAPAPRIGRYQLIDRIGGGTTSDVYAAVDDSGKAVVVKTMAADLADDPETRERFYREGRVTAGLRHPNVVEVLDIGEDAHHPFIVMEQLQGVSLPEHLRLHPQLSLQERLSLICQLCDGLQAAHDRGVVHRDVKPNNLFIEESGHLKVLDFGLARLNASTLTARGQVVGTPDFMSPEQATGHQVDARSDVFSAGAVAYYILTGRAPFSSTDLRKTLHALLNEAPAPISETEAPGFVARVLAKAMAKEPERRYASCASMRAELSPVSEGSAVWKRIAAYVGVIRP